MPKYVIERDIPGVGNFTGDQIQGASQKSCAALTKLGPRVQWLESHVTDSKVYCVYIAPDKPTILEHARLAGLPVNRVLEVRRIIDPTVGGA